MTKEVHQMKDISSECFKEWCRIDDLLRGHLYSLEHLQAVRILLENLPSEEWKRGKSVILEGEMNGKDT